MAGYLLCIESESGVPVFARKVGEIAPIEFPLAASLNGVMVFGKGQGIDLLTTTTASTRSVWKDYHGRLALVFLGTDDSPTEAHMTRVIDLVFSVFVFHVGLDSLIATPSVDRLKRELRGCYPMIDKLLQGLRPTQDTTYFGDMTLCPDVGLSVDAALQSGIETLAGSSSSTYLCLSSRGVELAATKDWHALAGEEAVLLLFKAHEVNDPTAEMTVFLPHTGQQFPFRLVVFKLRETLRLSLLCGSQPPLPLLQKEVRKWEGRMSELLTDADDIGLRMAATAKYFQIDPTIGGFLVVNTQTSRCAHALSPDNAGSKVKAAQKLETLRVFYRNTIHTFLGPEVKGQSHDKTEPIAKEAIWGSEYHGCHAMSSPPFLLFVVYEAGTGTARAAMRLSSQRLLLELSKDRGIKFNSSK